MNYKINHLLAPFQKLTSKDQKIYQYIDAISHESFTLSQKQLAQTLQVSEATISRFVKKMGFKDYKTFVIKINQDLSLYQNDFFSFDKKNFHAIADIITSHKIIFEKNINYELLKKAEDLAKLMIQKKRIVIFGLGTSLFLAGELASNVQRLNINAIAPRDFHSLLPLIGDPTQAELFIFISNNFQNREIDFAISHLRHKQNIFMITSHQTKAHDLGLDYENVLVYSKAHSDDHKISFSAKNAVALIIDFIFLFLLENSAPQQQRNYHKGMAMIEKWKNWNS